MLDRRLIFETCALLLLAIAAASPVNGQQAARPKFGAGAVRLFDSREFVKQQPAPDFWAIIPYHVAQVDNTSCSAASAAMVFNALRVHRQLSAHHSLATPVNVVSQVDPASWSLKLTETGPGVTLDELANLLPKAAKGFELGKLNVETVRFNPDTKTSLPELRRLLIENEKSDRDFIIVNFLQSELTGDPAGAVGHMAPLGAYDAGSDRVLLFDPDREWYEPYWVSSEQLLKAMNTQDSVSEKSRGLIRVQRGAE